MSEELLFRAKKFFRCLFVRLLVMLLGLSASIPIHGQDAADQLPYAFAEDITSVRWEVLQEYDTEYRHVDSSQPVTIRNNDTYRLTINYALPKNSLSANQLQCVYQLPEVFVLSEAANGIIYEDNVQVGTYTIDTEGQILLLFDGSMAEKNQDQTIYGDVQFTIQGSGIQVSDPETTKVKFNDRIEFTLDPSSTQPDPGGNEVWVRKSGEKTDNRTASYTIVVTAQEDTDVLSITDSLKNGEAAYRKDSLQITRSDGSAVDVDESAITWNDDSFSVTLPGLKKGESYTIAYEMVPQKTGNKENNTLKNYVEVQTGSSTAGTWGPDLTYTYSMLKKVGTKNADGTITWTIVVNEAKEDLNGWTLKDVFNETDLRLEADIAPPVDGKDTIELPYRFEQEDHTTYTITYTTKEEVLLGWQQAVNKAVLEKGDESIEQETGVYIPECEPYDPLIKEGIGILASGNDPMQARWNVLIDLSYSSLQPGWTYEDTLSGEDPYFSPEQKEQLEKAVMDAFGLKESEINKNENGFTSGVIDLVWKKESWEPKTKGFVITGHTVIEQGKNIAFSYESGSGADTASSPTTERNRS